MASSWADFFAGVCGGGSGIIVGQPLDTIRVRLQTQAVSLVASEVGALQVPIYSGAIDCFFQIIRNEGIPGLFRGLLPPLTCVSAQNSILFMTYGASKRKWVEMWDSNSSSKTVSLAGIYFSGAVSGISCAVVTVPSELVKCRLQVDSMVSTTSRYHGPLSVVQDVIKTHGVFGLYHGLWVTLLRDAPSYGVYFWTYESLCRRLTGSDNETPSTLVVLLAGGVAGSVSWGCIYPLDVVKSRLQTQPNTFPPRYSGIIDCYRKSIATEGPSFLFRGLVPTLLRAFPVNAVTFLMYETTMAMLTKSPIFASSSSSI